MNAYLEGVMCRISGNSVSSIVSFLQMHSDLFIVAALRSSPAASCTPAAPAMSESVPFYPGIGNSDSWVLIP